MVSRVSPGLAGELFETGYLSHVVGIRLATGGDVVEKIRAWQDRLASCGQVQHVLWDRGFPAPRLLVPPLRFGDLAVSAESLVHEGELLPARPDSARCFADGLARLVRTVPMPYSRGPKQPGAAG